MSKSTCSPWERVHKKSGATVHERTCGPFKASIMLWKPGEYSVAISRTTGGHVAHVYGKTLAIAKKAATAAMRRRR